MYRLGGILVLQSPSIKKYQPEFMKNLKEFQEIADTENEELAYLIPELNALFSDQFIETLTENGCKRWESILKIKPKLSDSLEVRRFRIKARINEYLPYTYRMLKNQLAILCGEMGYSVELKHKEYSLFVRVNMENKKKYQEILETIIRIIPANLVLDISLLYMRHFEVSQFRSRLLANYTHTEIRERKLPYYTENKLVQEIRNFGLKRYMHNYIREELYK